MAIRLVCDGCGKTADNPDDFNERGYVVTKRRHYCGPCDKKVVEWLDERDKLHTRLADEWAEQMDAARYEFFKAHREFELPDEDRGPYDKIREAEKRQAGGPSDDGS